MAENKKISELDQIQSLSNDDEFMVVDKSTTSGMDASSSGKTTRVTLNQLKEAVSASGAKGERGAQGAQGVQGPKGADGSQGSKGATGASGTSTNGVKGSTGATGARGPEGQKGATGATGVGQKGATGSGGQKGANGSQGQKGATGATGSGGQKGATGAKGTAGSPGSHGNVNHQHRFQQTNGTVDSTGQKLRKTAGGGQNWNTQIFTTNSYANGCYVSFSTEGYPIMMLGLNQGSDLSTNSYQTLDYSWYVHENKNLAIYESGQGRGMGTYSPADILTITYDNHSIRYLQNGEIKRTVVVGAGKRFHMDSSLHMNGKTAWATSMLAFGASGSVGSTGASGAKGAKGATGVGQKGASGASGVFAGGTVSAPIVVNSSTDEKLILQGSSNPYIRWKEGTTNKAFIQWNASGYLHIHNNETDTRFYIQNASTKIQTKHGYADIGAMNTGHFHFQTDRSNFYFNKQLQVHGSIIDYASKATYYHSGNLNAVRKSFPGAGSTGHYGLDNWLDFSVSSNHGIYWSKGTGKGWHIYPKGTNDMYIRSGNATNTALAFTNNNATPRGYVYADNNNSIGFLNNSRSWRFRVGIDHNSIYGSSKSPNLYFQENGAKTWTGDAGSNQGKIEYHSNRFYINAGTNSNRIVQFRRGGSDMAYISNGGVFVGPGVDLPGGIALRNTGSLDLKVSNKYGWYTMGTRNSSHCHFDTDRGSFYFYKGAYVQWVHSYANITVGPSTSDLKTTHIGKSGNITIGHNDTAREGGQLNLRYPGRSDNGFTTKNSPKPNKNKYGFVDVYYDDTKWLHGEKCAYVSLGHNGYTHDRMLNISEVYQHTLNGHLTLYDGNNAACFYTGRPGDTRNQSFYFRRFTSTSNKSLTQDTMRLEHHSGNMLIRGRFFAQQNISDIRQKKEIEKMNPSESLKKLMKLKPVRFNWKDASKNKNQYKQMGLIAQEAEQIIPSVVTEQQSMDHIHDISKPNANPAVSSSAPLDDVEKLKTIEYTELVPLLISAVQQLTHEVQILKQQK